jgi:hypothetical protein
MAEKSVKDWGHGLATLVISAIILVIIGLIFFTVNLWIVKTGADILDLDAGGDLVVLSAALLSAAALIGSKARNA